MELRGDVVGRLPHPGTFVKDGASTDSMKDWAGQVLRDAPCARCMLARNWIFGGLRSLLPRISDRVPLAWIPAVAGGGPDGRIAP